jgi:hypothetical protein
MSIKDLLKDKTKYIIITGRYYITTKNQWLIFTKDSIYKLNNNDYKKIENQLKYERRN